MTNLKNSALIQNILVFTALFLDFTEAVLFQWLHMHYVTFLEVVFMIIRDLEQCMKRTLITIAFSKATWVPEQNFLKG